MSKLKRKDWQYRRKERSPVSEAAKLALLEWKTKQDVAKKMAVDKYVDDLTKRHAVEVTNEFTDWDYACAALALHRRYNFDAKECADFLGEMQEILREHVASGMNHSDIWDVVRDEIGLDVVVED